MKHDLNKKIAHGVSWGIVETLSSYSVRFVIGIILARLLTPDDYGLIGMITIFLSISDVFINAGFGQAFIQKKNATYQDANTVFFINLFLGIGIYIIFWFCAPLISQFFNQPILTTLVRIFFVVIIINSLNIIQQSIIRKELLFKKRATITILSSTISGIIGIFCAYYGLGVWSLVIQQICNKIILCVLFYYTSSWRPSFEFSKESAKAMFGFGSWLMVSNFMIAVFNQFYRFFIGKTFSSEQLGLYDRAQQFESMIADTFTWVIAQVAFPVFSKIQDDTKEIEKTIVGFIRFSTFVVFPLLAILFVISEPLILLLLTEKWAKTISLLKSFCLVGLMKPIYKFFGPMLQGLGHSKLDMMFTALLSIGRVLNVLITYRHGLQYIIIGEFFVLLFGIIIISICAKNKINFNFLTLFWVVKWNGVATLIITVLGLFLISLPKTHIFQILFSSLTMGLAYLAIMRIFDKNLFFSLKSIILKQNRN